MIVPSAAAQIATWDARSARHVTVASRGYDRCTREALNGTKYTADRVWKVIEGSADAVFWRDCPFDRRESPFYVDVLAAHGYKEGATMLLRGGDGTHLGMLTFSLESDTTPDTSARDTLGILSAGLVPLVDRLAPARQFAALAGSSRAAAALDAEYGWVSLTPDRVAPTGMLTAAQTFLGRSDGRPIRFRWDDESVPARRGAIETLQVEVFTLNHPTCHAVACWQVGTIPYHLTRRECQVLAGIAGGLSNPGIAAELCMSVRTVTTHVEHILSKLGVATRTEAALIADREGLLTP